MQAHSQIFKNMLLPSIFSPMHEQPVMLAGLLIKGVRHEIMLSSGL